MKFANPGFGLRCYFGFVPIPFFSSVYMEADAVEINMTFLFVARLDEPNVGHRYAQGEFEVAFTYQFIFGSAALTGFQ